MLSPTVEKKVKRLFLDLTLLYTGCVKFSESISGTVKRKLCFELLDLPSIITFLLSPPFPFHDISPLLLLFPFSVFSSVSPFLS